MSQATTASGRFVWYDLMTTDLEKSIHFYSRLFGWKVKKVDMGPEIGIYHMIESDGQDIGGMVGMDEEGVPSHWIGYLSVDDVDQAADSIVREAGSLPRPPMDIPNVGRFCVAGDPGGAYFAPFSFPQGQEPSQPPRSAPGHFCWNEVHVPKSSQAKCKEFYQKIIGWQTKDTDMGPMGVYTLFRRPDGQDAAGMMALPEDSDQAGYWLTYIQVGSVDASVEQAEELEAETLKEASDIPNMGRFAVLRDPTGAGFALWKPA
ncbi:MAG TPA: VOC family protein [Acidobacteriota bacterium]|nr:VOC family protein [Acidobacteriota bacterium]